MPSHDNEDGLSIQVYFSIFSLTLLFTLSSFTHKDSILSIPECNNVSLVDNHPNIFLITHGVAENVTTWSLHQWHPQCKLASVSEESRREKKIKHVLLSSSHND